MRLLTAGSLVRVQLEEPLYRGIAQLVEHRSPKPSAVGSIPTAPANAAIAQSVECILGKDEVTSSNLVSSSIQTSDHLIRRFSFTAKRDLCREMTIENYFHLLLVDF